MDKADDIEALFKASKSFTDAALGDSKALTNEITSKGNEESHFGATGTEERLGENEDGKNVIRPIDSLSMEIDKAYREHDICALFKASKSLKFSGSMSDEETLSGATTCNEERPCKSEDATDSMLSIYRLSLEMDKAYRERNINALFEAAMSLIDVALKDTEALKDEVEELKKDQDLTPASLKSDLLLEENAQLRKQVKTLMEYIEIRESDVQRGLSKMNNEMDLLFEDFNSRVCKVQKRTREQLSRSKMLTAELREATDKYST